VGTLQDGTDLGMSDDNGYEISYTTHADLVNRSDGYGMTLLDFVNQGADWRMRWRAIEWRDGSVRASWPWGGVAGALNNNWDPLLGAVGTIAGVPNQPIGNVGAGIAVAGSLGSQFEHAITLTATPGTPAENKPQSIACEHCILSPNINLSSLYTSKARQIPLEYVLFPYISGSNIVWFLTA
jgi:hypothetical protein